MTPGAHSSSVRWAVPVRGRGAREAEVAEVSRLGVKRLWMQSLGAAPNPLVPQRLVAP